MSGLTRLVLAVPNDDVNAVPKAERTAVAFGTLLHVRHGGTHHLQAIRPHQEDIGRSRSRLAGILTEATEVEQWALATHSSEPRGFHVELMKDAVVGDRLPVQQVAQNLHDFDRTLIPRTGRQGSTREVARDDVDRKTTP